MRVCTCVCTCVCVIVCVCVCVCVCVFAAGFDPSVCSGTSPGALHSPGDLLVSSRLGHACSAL